MKYMTIVLIKCNISIISGGLFNRGGTVGIATTGATNRGASIGSSLLDILFGRQAATTTPPPTFNPFSFQRPSRNFPSSIFGHRGSNNNQFNLGSLFPSRTVSRNSNARFPLWGMPRIPSGLSRMFGSDDDSSESDEDDFNAYDFMFDGLSQNTHSVGSNQFSSNNNFLNQPQSASDQSPASLSLFAMYDSGLGDTGNNQNYPYENIVNSFLPWFGSTPAPSVQPAWNPSTVSTLPQEQPITTLDPLFTDLNTTTDIGPASGNFSTSNVFKWLAQLLLGGSENSTVSDTNGTIVDPFHMDSFGSSPSPDMVANYAISTASSVPFDAINTTSSQGTFESFTTMSTGGDVTGLIESSTPVVTAFDSTITPTTDVFMGAFDSSSPTSMVSGEFATWPTSVLPESPITTPAQSPVAAPLNGTSFEQIFGIISALSRIQNDTVASPIQSSTPIDDTLTGTSSGALFGLSAGSHSYGANTDPSVPTSGFNDVSYESTTASSGSSQPMFDDIITSTAPSVSVDSSTTVEVFTESLSTSTETIITNPTSSFDDNNSTPSSKLDDVITTPSAISDDDITTPSAISDDDITTPPSDDSNPTPGSSFDDSNTTPSTDDTAVTSDALFEALVKEEPIVSTATPETSSSINPSGDTIVDGNVFPILSNNINVDAANNATYEFKTLDNTFDLSNAFYNLTDRIW